MQKSTNKLRRFTSDVKKWLSGLTNRPLPRVHISCVVDDRPEFRMQAWNWLLSLAALSSECRVFVHYLPGALSEQMQDQFRSLGATIVQVQPFGEGEARYCNKIRQLETKAFLDADFIILSDTDIVFLEDPAHLVRPGKFRAKTVDGPNPPEEVWVEIFRQTGLLERVDKIALDMFAEKLTFSTNFNGGLYVMPATSAHHLHPLWEKHARYCLEQPTVLGKHLHHADQLGMGLALAESGDAIDFLPFGANLPTNFSSAKLGLVPSQAISALHYHSNMDQHGLPKRVGVSWIDDGIDRIRSVIENERRKGFLNDIFWDFRYSSFPELGSGLGSRQEALLYKRDVLGPYIDMIGERSILDVGCGDIEVLGAFPINNYTGIDVSDQALSIARDKRPDWRFENRSVSDFPEGSFDYTFCIDVFIHQPSTDAARSLAHNLVRVANRGVIFSCHSQPTGSGISFNSNEIAAHIASLPNVVRIKEIGEYRDVKLYFAEKELAAQTPTT